jgi:hypothetical protein
MSSIPRYSEAAFIYDKLFAKLTILNKKLESITHQLSVEENAFELRKQPIDDDKGYNYYVKERDSATKGLENARREIDHKISKYQSHCDISVADLEQKKANAILDFDRKIEALKASTEAKISALEDKKDNASVEFERRIEYHQKSILNITTKFDNAKPTSTAYTKLVSNKEQTQKEIDEVSGELQQALVVMMAAQRKESENRAAEEKQRLKREERDQFLKDEEERKRIEQDRENTRKAEMERAKQRSEAAKIQTTTIEESNLQFAFTPPPKKIKKAKGRVKKLSFPLDPKKQYTVDELDTIDVDYEKDGDANCELYDKLYHEASVREGVYGAWECKEECLYPE